MKIALLVLTFIGSASIAFADAPFTPKQKYDAALKKARDAYVVAFEKAEAQFDRDYRDAIAIEMKRATPDALDKANELNAERKDHLKRLDDETHPELELSRLAKGLQTGNWVQYWTDKGPGAEKPLKIIIDANGVDKKQGWRFVRSWVLMHENEVFFHIGESRFRGTTIEDGRPTGLKRID